MWAFDGALGIPLGFAASCYLWLVSLHSLSLTVRKKVVMHCQGHEKNSEMGSSLCPGLRKHTFFNDVLCLEMPDVQMDPDVYQPAEAGVGIQCFDKTLLFCSYGAMTWIFHNTINNVDFNP